MAIPRRGNLAVDHRAVGNCGLTAACRVEEPRCSLTRARKLPRAVRKDNSRNGRALGARCDQGSLANAGGSRVIRYAQIADCALQRSAQGLNVLVARKAPERMSASIKRGGKGSWFLICRTRKTDVGNERECYVGATRETCAHVLHELGACRDFDKLVHENGDDICIRHD